jgi:ribonuclease HI
MPKFIIYTDGSSRGNPGRGGWGVIIEERDTSNELRIKELGGREEMTTNNRMEMTASIEGLRNTPENSDIEIYTDSEYLMKGITLWIHNWQKNNWRTKDKKDVLNKDLWLLLLEETQKRKVVWKKVRGHSGDKLNDRCDEIATGFADGKSVSLYNGLKQGYYLFHQDQ